VWRWLGASDAPTPHRSALSNPSGRHQIRLAFLENPSRCCRTRLAIVEPILISSGYHRAHLDVVEGPSGKRGLVPGKLKLLWVSLETPKTSKTKRHPESPRAKSPMFELPRALPKHCQSIPEHPQSIPRALPEHLQSILRAFPDHF